MTLQVSVVIVKKVVDGPDKEVVVEEEALVVVLGVEVVVKKLAVGVIGVSTISGNVVEVVPFVVGSVTEDVVVVIGSVVLLVVGVVVEVSCKVEVVKRVDTAVTAVVIVGGGVTIITGMKVDVR